MVYEKSKYKLNLFTKIVYITETVHYIRNKDIRSPYTERSEIMGKVNYMMTAQDVADALGCSVGKVYIVIKSLNDELKEM